MELHGYYNDLNNCINPSIQPTPIKYQAVHPLTSEYNQLQSKQPPTVTLTPNNQNERESINTSACSNPNQKQGTATIMRKMDTNNLNYNVVNPTIINGNLDSSTDFNCNIQYQNSKTSEISPPYYYQKVQNSYENVNNSYCQYYNEATNQNYSKPVNQTYPLNYHADSTPASCEQYPIMNRQQSAYQHPSINYKNTNNSPGCGIYSPDNVSNNGRPVYIQPTSSSQSEHHYNDGRYNNSCNFYQMNNNQGNPYYHKVNNMSPPNSRNYPPNYYPAMARPNMAQRGGYMTQVPNDNYNFYNHHHLPPVMMRPTNYNTNYNMTNYRNSMYSTTAESNHHIYDDPYHPYHNKAYNSSTAYNTNHKNMHYEDISQHTNGNMRMPSSYGNSSKIVYGTGINPTNYPSNIPPEQYHSQSYGYNIMNQPEPDMYSLNSAKISPIVNPNKPVRVHSFYEQNVDLEEQINSSKILKTSFGNNDYHYYDKGKFYHQFRRGVNQLDENLKNQNLREFLSSWNEDEEGDQKQQNGSKDLLKSTAHIEINNNKKNQEFYYNQLGNKKDYDNMDPSSRIHVGITVGNNLSSNSNLPDIIIDIEKTKSNNDEISIGANSEKLYVLESIDVPISDLGKYKHLSVLNKLPENIVQYAKGDDDEINPNVENSLKFLEEIELNREKYYKNDFDFDSDESNETSLEQFHSNFKYEYKGPSSICDLTRDDEDDPDPLVKDILKTCDEIVKTDCKNIDSNPVINEAINCDININKIINEKSSEIDSNPTSVIEPKLYDDIFDNRVIDFAQKVLDETTVVDDKIDEIDLQQIINENVTLIESNQDLSENEDTIDTTLFFDKSVSDIEKDDQQSIICDNKGTEDDATQNDEQSNLKLSEVEKEVAEITNAETLLNLSCQKNMIDDEINENECDSEKLLSQKIIIDDDADKMESDEIIVEQTFCETTLDDDSRTIDDNITCNGTPLSELSNDQSKCDDNDLENINQADDQGIDDSPKCEEVKNTIKSSETSNSDDDDNNETEEENSEYYDTDEDTDESTDDREMETDDSQITNDREETNDNQIFEMMAENNATDENLQDMNDEITKTNQICRKRKLDINENQENSYKVQNNFLVQSLKSKCIECINTNIFRKSLLKDEIFSSPSNCSQILRRTNYRIRKCIKNFNAKKLKELCKDVIENLPLITDERKTEVLSLKEICENTIISNKDIYWVQEVSSDISTLKILCENVLKESNFMIDREFWNNDDYCIFKDEDGDICYIQKEYTTEIFEDVDIAYNENDISDFSESYNNLNNIYEEIIPINGQTNRKRKICESLRYKYNQNSKNIINSLVCKILKKYICYYQKSISSRNGVRQKIKDRKMKISKIKLKNCDKKLKCLVNNNNPPDDEKLLNMKNISLSSYSCNYSRKLNQESHLIAKEENKQNNIFKKRKLNFDEMLLNIDKFYKNPNHKNRGHKIKENIIVITKTPRLIIPKSKILDMDELKLITERNIARDYKMPYVKLERSQFIDKLAKLN